MAKQLYFLLATLCYSSISFADLVEPVEVLYMKDITPKQRVAQSCHSIVSPNSYSGSLSQNRTVMQAANANNPANRDAANVITECQSVVLSGKETYKIQYKHRGYLKEAVIFCKPTKDMTVNTNTEQVICPANPTN